MIFVECLLCPNCLSVLFNGHNSKEKTHLTLRSCWSAKYSWKTDLPRRQGWQCLLNTAQERGHSGQEAQVGGFPRQGCTSCVHECGALAADPEQGDWGASARSSATLFSILPTADGLPMLVGLSGAGDVGHAERRILSYG